MPRIRPSANPSPPAPPPHRACGVLSLCHKRIVGGEACSAERSRIYLPGLALVELDLGRIKLSPSEVEAGFQPRPDPPRSKRHSFDSLTCSDENPTSGHRSVSNGETTSSVEASQTRANPSQVRNLPHAPRRDKESSGVSPTLQSVAGGLATPPER